MVVCSIVVSEVSISVSSGVAGDESSDHKIWSMCGSDGCKCGAAIHGSVQYCSNDTLWIQPCYCMFYDETRNVTMLGSCLFTCYNFRSSGIQNYYYPVKRYSVKNAASLNDEMCSPSISSIDTNRTGRFCGRCKEGHSLAVYSYHYTSCIPCTDYGYKNWLRYFAVSLLPLTLLYFLVISLKISVTSSKLNGLIFFAQCVASPAQI